MFVRKFKLALKMIYELVLPQPFSTGLADGFLVLSQFYPYK